MYYACHLKRLNIDVLYTVQWNGTGDKLHFEYKVSLFWKLALGFSLHMTKSEKHVYVCTKEKCFNNFEMERCKKKGSVKDALFLIHGLIYIHRKNERKKIDAQ